MTKYRYYKVSNQYITLLQIPFGSIICHECFVIFQNVNYGSSMPERVFGHREVCLGCGISILRKRSYRVALLCPERSVILRWIRPSQIPRLTRVCAGCWRTANREVQRQRLHDSGRPLAQIDDTPNEPHIPLPPPLPIPHQLPIPHIRAAVAKIQSSVYKRAAASSSVCLFLGCQRPERLLVPKQIKDMLLIHKKFYVPNSARICHHHLQNGNWMDLTSNLHDFTGVQFDIILKTLEKAAEYHLDFNNISTMAPSLCHYWLGMSYEQFDELLACVPSLSQSVKNYHLALCIYIVKLRTGDSNERLSSLFRIPR
ncbi:hypothetical protein ACJJTC_009942, partial [Scirpophaga incertulas]